MRYLLHESQAAELTARQGYLYNIFHVYFLPGQPEGGYIPLTPVGESIANILFITGHTNYVLKYLATQIDSIPENHIVITSCMGRIFRLFASKRKIYIPNTQTAFCYLRNGIPYGFDFPISDAELDFYNSTGDVMERIHSAYYQLPYREAL